MKTFEHGLVIGKFYPPHAGHHFLIEAAREQCKIVTVVVEHTRYQRIPAADRVAWLYATHGFRGIRFIANRNDLPINLTDTPTWEAEVAIVRQSIATSERTPVDAVFSSEFYGDRLATYFNATHVMVDQPRATIPMSATKFRASPVTYWNNLAPATRSGLTTRICVVGAESTGTTTVSRMLTDYYRNRRGFEGTQCVPEYGREYAAKRAADAGDINLVQWEVTDFDIIGQRQNEMERAAALTGSPVLICDTDALATTVWARRYLPLSGRSVHGWSVRPWASQSLPVKDVYLITDHHDVPWEDDGVREGDLTIRAGMTQKFIRELSRRDQSWVLLTGSLDDRFRLAHQVSDMLLAERLTL